MHMPVLHSNWHIASVMQSVLMYSNCHLAAASSLVLLPAQLGLQLLLQLLQRVWQLQLVGQGESPNTACNSTLVRSLVYGRRCSSGKTNYSSFRF
jgi:hypothetical protein